MSYSNENIIEIVVNYMIFFNYQIILNGYSIYLIYISFNYLLK